MADYIGVDISKSTCSIDDCRKPVVACGWCRMHYERDRRHGDPNYLTRSPELAERKFRERLAELGAILLETEWLGARTPHRVICVNGHECSPRPNNADYVGICEECVGRSPRASEANFRARLDEAGATLLEPEYLGARRAHRARCAAGHDCTPYPGNLQTGLGVICRICADAHATIFYVTVNDALHRVKFGITSGDPNNRLRVHRRSGYLSVIRIIEGMEDALVLESIVRATLRDAGFEPVHGREFFDVAAVPIILDLADSYPITQLIAA